METQVVAKVDNKSTDVFVYLEENFNFIMTLYSADVYPIERRAANEMLELFRKALRRHNTKRHKITLSDRDGVAVLLVNGSAHWLWRRSFRHRTDAINTLLRIQALLDIKFVQYVRNERIN